MKLTVFYFPGRKCNVFGTDISLCPLHRYVSQYVHNLPNVHVIYDIVNRCYLGLPFGSICVIT